MNTSGIQLMAFTRTSEESRTPGSPGTLEDQGPAYNDPAFTYSEKLATSSSASSIDIDDATAANTYANSAPLTAHAPVITTASSAGPPSVSDHAGSSSPVLTSGRHNSTVGFRLPEGVGKRDGANSSASGKEKEHVWQDEPYRGMGKDDLLRHSAKPFWRRLRYMCMSVVMVGWLALIITVVTLVLVYPRCRSAPDQQWWRTAVVYRIYVRSFQDHDGDGIGDLDGINSRLGYLKEIGVTTISLSPIYRTSPGSQSDTEIVDHKDIAPEYGTLGKFTQLVNSSHQQGIRVLLDFIPNHTGLDHPWFLESKNGTTNPKRNFYVWEKGYGSTKLLEPNNWCSVYNGSAWDMEMLRGEYYLHQFRSTQPDLNLRSSEVKEHLQSILQFWLDMGVDGFYVRDSGFLFEDYDIRDDILLPNKTDMDLYASYNHTYTYGRNEIHDMFARWRAFLDDYGNKTGKYKLLYADRKGAVQDLMTYYGHFNRDGVNFPLNTFCLDLDQSTSGKGVARMVRQWLNNLPPDRWANWLGGTDNSVRMIDRLGEKAIRPYLTLMMLLPGTPVLYYGDEIGMSGLQAHAWEVQAGQRNLSMRSPMQWDNTSYAGFCECTKGLPWTPLHPRFSALNVENQRGESHSIFHLFTNLTSLRAQYSSFHYGDYNEAVVDDQVFSFVRDYDGEKGFLVALNFANITVSKNYAGSYSTVPGRATVALRTGSDVKLNKGDKVSTSNLELGPHQGVVLSWDYVAKEL